MSDEYTPGQIAAGDQRIAGVRKNIEKGVWVWRMTTYRHQCGPEGCHVTDPARQALDFAEVLREQFEAISNGFVLLCEMLAVAVAQCGDQTHNAMSFYRTLEDEFWSEPDRVWLLCQWLTIALAELAKAPVDPPEHLWVAAGDTNAHCSCNWTLETADRGEAERAWEAHAGADCLIMEPWQEQWLDRAS